MTRVRITDVSPRDGLQNEPGRVRATDKADLVQSLARAGLDEVEVTSFVSPKWVPQLGDAADVLEILAATLHPSPQAKGQPRPVLSVLVPNERGLTAAIEANRTAARVNTVWQHEGPRALVQKVSVFTAASETFSRKNTNATIAEALTRFVPVVHDAKSRGLLVRGYISCVIACPFEGVIAPSKVAEVCERLAELGVDELDLGDTIGAGNPETVRAMLQAVVSRVGQTWLGPRLPNHPSEFGITLHLHDTFGLAAACVSEALDLGVRSFDASAGGLGGCPYASTPGKRAPGNISTETLVQVVRAWGGDGATRIDQSALASAARLARQLVSSANAEQRN